MKTLGFIGMGNMAGAIAAGILQKGLMKKEEVFAYAPHYEKLEANAEKIGFVPCKDLKGLTAKADTLVMACKPYQIEGVLSEIKEELKGKALISSLSSGKSEFFSSNKRTPSPTIAGVFGIVRITFVFSPSLSANHWRVLPGAIEIKI